ncbi:hypothetical protein KFK09_024790 [Dendrobium nobile]|uniref:Uncharacterized protein n=1 Tax=Dendrobium nobile TaxID=94219 RepID=A0A8T3A6M9_DENNO|nr:hypothetical protein KFK09_026473 [Dendrobium nobile]KAI0492277.1 hypothetical protein KFK09_026546 [Dendrobium nobile]KAI0494649.1 hypothetical protein KFK09_024790 [Dendrobium nobile]
MGNFGPCLRMEDPTYSFSHQRARKKEGVQPGLCEQGESERAGVLAAFLPNKQRDQEGDVRAGRFHEIRVMEREQFAK